MRRHTGFEGRLRHRLGGRRRQQEAGFTLIELLVVIIILGILAAVVVFAVGGVGDKGQAAAREIDRRTLVTAEEAYFANNGRYGTEAELVGGGLLSEESNTHKVYLNSGPGPCPAGNRCEYSIGVQDEPASLTAYIGRSNTLVTPAFLAQFTTDTGIAVTTNFGSGTGDKSTLLATQIVTEGANTPADVFFAQDAANLGKVSRAGLFRVAPAGASGRVTNPGFQATDNTWTAVSGRVRVIAHNPAVTPAASVPDDVDDLLTQADRSVGYDPANASFQNFVAAMILQRGRLNTEAWLTSFMIKGYCVVGNRNIAAAVALNNPLSIKLGLINHYYRFQAMGSPAFNTAAVVNTHPVSTVADPDPGSLINAAGIGILKNTDNPGAAEMFVRYMLADTAQTYYKNSTSEYPVVASVAPRPEIPPLSSIQAANTVNGLDLNDLDIDEAVAAEAAVGMLPVTPSPTGTGAPNSCRSTIP